MKCCFAFVEVGAAWLRLFGLLVDDDDDFDFAGGVGVGLGDGVGLGEGVRGRRDAERFLLTPDGPRFWEADRFLDAERFFDVARFPASVGLRDRSRPRVVGDDDVDDAPA